MKRIAIFFILIISGSMLYAQSIELNELSSPSTPAFTLLGLSPTNVSRPTLTKPFLMSLANGLDGKSLASDVAVEVTPYWWKSRPGLTYEEYYGLNKEKASANIPDQIARTLALSFATSDAAPNVDSIDSRYLAAGLRFQVLNGKPSGEFTQTYKDLQYNELLKRETIGDLQLKARLNAVSSYSDLKNKVRSSVHSLILTNDNFNTVSGEKKTVYENAVVDYVSSSIQEWEGLEFNKDSAIVLLEKERGGLTDTVNETLIKMQGMSRVGWLLEFAGAASLLAPTNKIDYTIGHDWAYWGTLTYRFDKVEGNKKVNDFNLMLRVGGNFQHPGNSNQDLGLSWVTIGDNHSLTLEGIFRNYHTFIDITATDGKVYEVSETSTTWRFALAYQYQFSETVNISITAGKDFENSVISAGGVFSLVNLNLAIPSKQILSVR